MQVGDAWAGRWTTTVQEAQVKNQRTAAANHEALRGEKDPAQLDCGSNCEIAAHRSPRSTQAMY
jgi:hypothetical protein